MKIGFGSDHAAVDMKNALKEHLAAQGHEVVDFGTDSAEHRADYPEKALAVAEAIKAGEIDKGVLCCGTGIGMCLAANKVPGIRAAVCSEPYSAELTVRHNNSQIITIGARVIGEELAKMTVDAFFNAEFEGGRHAKRVDMITAIEEKYSKEV